ncbi:MAG: VWA domain-containing protein [Candidatus Omnitrophica bacterium]|nr:VWA domain-containing protein [Candidatus Omnitrophota bacterium]
MWLWRLSATRKEFLIASLVPFEHLLPRPPQRRSRLLVNLLFWIQLAACILSACALAQPAMQRHQAKTTLVVLDTSASMYAKNSGISALSLAKRRLNQWLATKPETEQILLMTSAPVAPVLPRPQSDKTTLVQALKRVEGSHLSGNLASAVRAGSALLRRRPDKVLVVTDELQPAQLDERVQWIGMGRPLSNVGIVAASIEGTFCSPAQATVLVTLQNFSESNSSARLTAAYGAKADTVVAEESTTLSPWARQTLSLTLPAQNTRDFVELTLHAERDNFDWDNKAWLPLSGSSSSSMLLQVDSPSLKETLSEWLNACPAISWYSQPKPDAAANVVISDHTNGLPDSATLLIRLPVVPKPTLSYWVTSLAHPISAYLPPIGFLAAPISTVTAEAPAGTEVVSALFDGMRVPVVVADEHAGIRRVHFFFDPSRNIDSTLSALIFFNSLRWLANETQIKTAGESLVQSDFHSGSVQVRRPDNRYDSIESIEGKARYDKTTLAGLYLFTQGKQNTYVPVNFLNPAESNLIRHASTWQPLPSEKDDSASAPLVLYPLAPLLTGLVLILLLLEWGLHAWRNQKHPKSKI